MVMNWNWSVGVDSYIKHAYISYLCPLEGPRSKDTPVATRTSSDEMLISNTIIH